MSKKVKSVMVFTNGNTAVFDKDGQQIAELQGSCVNYDYIRKLAKLIAKNEINPTIQFGNLYDWRDQLAEMVRLERKQLASKSNPRDKR